MILIADISSNHDGKIENAKKIMKDLKESSGQMPVIAKFQYWNTDKFINQKYFENKKSHQSKWKDSVYATYKKYEMPIEWIDELSKYAKELEIGFSVSCYDIDSIDKILPYCDIIKIGSGDINYYEMLIKSSMFKKPVIISTGASTLEEMIQAVNVIEKINQDITIMQCNTNYEQNPENIKQSCINVLKSYKTYFPNYSIGLSDHSKSLLPIYAATCLGCKIIERHFKGNINTNSPDSEFSLNSMEWKYMVSETENMEYVLGNTYKMVMPNEIETRSIQRRCLYATKDLSIGHIITKDDIIAMRPAIENAFTPAVNLIGKKIKNYIKKDDALNFDNVELL